MSDYWWNQRVDDAVFAEGAERAQREDWEREQREDARVEWDEPTKTVLWCGVCDHVWPVTNKPDPTVSCISCGTILIQDHRELIPYSDGLRERETFIKAGMLPMRGLRGAIAEGITKATGVAVDPDTISDEHYYDPSRALFGLIEEESRCPACGEFIDYCQGHGDIGDPVGAATLYAHDEDNHAGCHPDSDCHL